MCTSATKSYSIVFIIITSSVPHTKRCGNAALQLRFHSFVCSLLLFFFFCELDVEKEKKNRLKNKEAISQLGKEVEEVRGSCLALDHTRSTAFSLPLYYEKICSLTTIVDCTTNFIEIVVTYSIYPERWNVKMGPFSQQGYKTGNFKREIQLLTDGLDNFGISLSISVVQWLLIIAVVESHY